MSSAPDLPPPMNHVFVDLENVHEVDSSLIGSKAVSLTLLLGAKQTKLDTTLVEKMLAHAAAVELIRLTSSGKNALDFALAYYVGRKVLADPTAYFHVISKDKGFDPLIEHLRSRHINARRHDNFASLTFSYKAKEAPTVTTKEPAEEADPVMAQILERLRKNVTNRPKKKTTLVRHLKSNLGKDATDTDALTLFENLSKAGHIGVDAKDAITYRV